MRVALVTLVILALSIYAWRDWFIPVCALVVMDAVMKHEDMPRSFMGVQGLNLWNILLLCAALAWLTDRIRGGTRREVPAWMTILSLAYVLAIVVAFVRGIVDIGSIRVVGDLPTARTPLGFISDYLINPLKYIFVAFLLFDGARTRRNLLLGLGAIFAQAGLYAIQVIRKVPPGVLLTSTNPYRYRIQRECGLHANDIALVMVVGFWGLMMCAVLWPYLRWWWRTGGIVAALATVIALALTMSRAGYLAFVVIGVLFGAVRWRPLLIIAPVAVLVVCLAFPSITARVSVGFQSTDVSGEEIQDIDAISAGRITNLWPATLDKIAESPLIGHGRLAIMRTSLYEAIAAAEGDCPEHPHNAYLEMLLDTGVVGLIVTLGCFLGLPLVVQIQRRSRQPLLSAAIGTGLAAACALLVMALTGQTFFPREGVFVVLCAYGLMMRAYLLDGCARFSVSGSARGQSQWTRSAEPHTQSVAECLSQSGRVLR